MKQLILNITVFSILAILPTFIFAQDLQSSANLIVTRGKGVGNTTLGMTKSEVEAILGKGFDNSGARLDYWELGISAYYDKTTNRITNITVLFKGYDRFKDFKGKIDGDVKTLPQILAKYGLPIDSETRKLTNETKNYVKFDGITFWLSDGKITEVAVTQMENVDLQKPNPTIDGKKTLADLNCEYILSETCNQILMEASENEIKNYYGNRFIESYRFTGEKAEVPAFSFYSVGLIAYVVFFPGCGKIDEDIDWSDKQSVVTRKFGTPKKSYKGKNVDGEKYEIIEYDNMEFQFTKGKLDKLTLKNILSESEAAAIHAKHMAEKAEAEMTANTPEAKAKEKAKKEQQIGADYKELLDQLDAKNQEGMRIVNSEKSAIAAGGEFKKAVEKKLDKVRSAGDSLIDSFNKKYEGMIPTWMIKAIADKWRPVQ